MIQRTLTSRNPLTKRLQRHAQFATLFRAVDSTSQPTYAQPLPMGMAAPFSADVPATLEAEAAARIVSPGQTPLASIAPLAQSPAQIQAKIDSPSQGQVAVAAPVTATPVSAESPVNLAPDETPALSPEERNWKRLQAIMSRHEEKAEAAQRGAVESPPLTARVQRQVAGMAPLPQANLPVSAASLGSGTPSVPGALTELAAPTANQPAQGVERLLNTEPTDTPVASSSVPTANQPARGAQPLPNIGPTGPTAASSPASTAASLPIAPAVVQRFTPTAAPQPTLPAQSVVAPTMTAQPAPASRMPTTPVLPGASVANPDLPIAKPVPPTLLTPAAPSMVSRVEHVPLPDSHVATGETTALAQPALAEPAEQVLTASRPDQAQPSVLSAANDTARLPESASLPASTAPETGVDEEMQRMLPLEQAMWSVQRQENLVTPTAPQPPAGTVWPEQLAPLPNAAVQTALQPIPTGQPTTSAIEVLAPRRPRPVVQRAAQPETQTTASTVAALPDQLPGSTRNEIGVPHSAVSGTQLSTPVATEIGALPGDLWELIGQPTPAPPSTLSSPTPAPTAPPVPSSPVQKPATSLPAPPVPGPLPARSLSPTSVSSAFDRSSQQVQPRSELSGSPVVPAFPAALALAPVGISAVPIGEVQRMPLNAPRQATSVSSDFLLRPQATGIEAMQHQDLANDMTAAASLLPAPHQADVATHRAVAVPWPALIEQVNNPAVPQDDRGVQRPISRVASAVPGEPTVVARAGSANEFVSVQRQPDVAANGTGNQAEVTNAVAANSQSTGEPAGHDPASAIDIDELARKVYANIKRRLFVEWERLLRG